MIWSKYFPNGAVQLIFEKIIEIEKDHIKDLLEINN